MSDQLRSVYRTTTCGALRPENVGEPATLAGWVHRKRDHGHLLFVDLRDHYGVTQCVFTPSSAVFGAASRCGWKPSSALSGTVVARDAENVNPSVATGLVELTPMGRVLGPADRFRSSVGAQDPERGLGTVPNSGEKPRTMLGAYFASEERAGHVQAFSAPRRKFASYRVLRGQ